jgi:hypothetical protein
MTALTHKLNNFGMTAKQPASQASERLNIRQRMAVRLATHLRIKAELQSNDFRNPETQRVYLSFRPNIY